MPFRSRPVLWLVSIVIAAGLVMGGWNLYQWNARLIQIGDQRIDPLATIDPERRYDILVWEHDFYIPGVDESLRRAALEAAAAELAELHPNITVRFEFLDAEVSLERLQEALEAGVGPDIAGLSGGAMLVDPSLQVPITPYIAPETTEDILPSVRLAIENQDYLWAWPRWIDIPVWLGQAQLMPGLEGRSSLSGSEWTGRGASWRSQIGNHPPLAYNAYDINLFQSIAVATTGRSLLTASGDVGWTQEDIEATAQFLADLAESGLAPKDAATVSRSRLRRFWDGHASVIAPVNNVLLHHALSRLGELTHDNDRNNALQGSSKLAILAAPHLGDQLEGVFGTVAAYAVFRREQHAGDDHTRAVMLVAEHLSHRAGHWEAATMLAVPAYASGLAQWERDSGLMQEHVDSLTTLARRLVAPPVDLHWASVEAEALERIFLPPLPNVLQGSLTPSQFADDVWRELGGFLAARPQER